MTVTHCAAPSMSVSSCAPPTSAPPSAASSRSSPSVPNSARAAATSSATEEPCWPDCTGCYPVAGWSYVAGAGGGCLQAAGQPGDSYGPTMAGPFYA